MEARCPRCGTRYYGWALRSPRHQTCSRCGVALVIVEDGKTTRGYSPLDAAEYRLKPAEGAPATKEEGTNPDEEED